MPYSPFGLTCSSRIISSPLSIKEIAIQSSPKQYKNTDNIHTVSFLYYKLNMLITELRPKAEHVNCLGGIHSTITNQNMV